MISSARAIRIDYLSNCNMIESPWLVNGGHGASLRHHKWLSLARTTGMPTALHTCAGDTPTAVKPRLLGSPDITTIVLANWLRISCTGALVASPVLIMSYPAVAVAPLYWGSSGRRVRGRTLDRLAAAATSSAVSLRTRWLLRSEAALRL
jgi:hypothetical protein